MLPGALSPCAINNRPTPVIVYITLGDAGRVAAKFFEVRSLGQSSTGKYPYF